MTTIILLFILLFVAAIFIILPLHFFSSDSIKKLKLKEVSTTDIVSIIMFVGTIKDNDDISSFLPYKIISHMKNSIIVKKRVWLIHSSISNEPGSSYQNACELSLLFSSENLIINTQCINNIFSIEESFNIVSGILSNNQNSKNDILCDFTSGTKTMSLGMALACIGDKRLIYFPHTKDNDAIKFLHMNTGELIKTDY